MEEKKNLKEIDIIGTLKQVWDKKRLLFKYLGVFAVLGIVVALVNPKEYTSDVLLAPEMNTGGAGLSESLSNMASTFGIDLGGKSGMDAIYPEIYPTVLVSNDFIMPLLDARVCLKKDTTSRSYYDHIKKDSRPGFWGYPGTLLHSLFPKKTPESYDKSCTNGPLSLTREQEGIINAIKGSIKCVIDSKTRIITIAVTDQDPLVASIIADSIQKHLRDYIIRYRTKKANNDLSYYRKLLSESKEEYQKAQRRYSSFCDANMKIALQSLEAKRDELENEMQIKFNVYNQMSNQVEHAKAKVQEQTPAFTIIQQATVPNRASSTPRSIIAILYFFIGGIFGTFHILFGENIKKLTHSIRK